MLQYKGFNWIILKKVILLSTISLSGYGIHRIFMFAKKAGFDGIDLWLSKFNLDVWDEDYIKELSDHFWVPILSVTAPSKGLNEKKVDKIIKIATKLEAQVVNFSPPHFSDTNTTWYTNYLSRVKKNTHLGISIKNVEPKFLFFIIPEYKNASLLEIKKITGDTSLDVSAIDSASSMDVLKSLSILWSSIKNIYLSDKRGPKKWLLPWNAWGGVSYLPLESLLMKLKIGGYNGFITLKVRPAELGVGTEEMVLQNLKYSINYYKKHFLDYK